ncbi:MAG: cbb3-type cytochrome c oxidase subunit II, partial [Planctomycetota bacterium]
CHSQMIRPIFSEVKRYGEYSKPGEFVYDRPFQWGSRRIGPDLAREGVIQPSSWWHYLHFMEPDQITAGSIMPSYRHLADQELDFDAILPRVQSMALLGVPYGDAVTNAAEMAREQAIALNEQITLESTSQGGEPTDIADRKMIALIAYMLRLGTDINKPAPEEAVPDDPAAESESPSSESPNEEAAANPETEAN